MTDSSGLPPSLMIVLASATTFIGIVALAVRRGAWRQAARKTPARAASPMYGISTWLLAAGLAWSLVLYVRAAYAYSEYVSSLSFLARSYGLSALVALCILVIGRQLADYPLSARRRGWVDGAVPGTYAAVVLFATLHVVTAFFANLDGNIWAVRFLSQKQQLAVIGGLILFCWLIVVTIAQLALRPRRRRAISRYLSIGWRMVLPLILLHAFWIGSHFAETRGWIPRLVAYLALTALLLEAGRFFRSVMRQRVPDWSWQQRLQLTGLVLVITGGMTLLVYGLRDPGGSSSAHHGTDHSMHGSAAQTGGAGAHTSLTYDTSYELKLGNTTQPLSKGQRSVFNFAITKGDMPQAAETFAIENESLLHLIIVSDNLSEFYHLHPSYDSGDRLFTTTFTPQNDGKYHLYASFAPAIGIEALAKATLPSAEPGIISTAIDLNSESRLDSEYTIRLEGAETLQASQYQQLAFAVSSAQTGGAITEFEPYLGQLAHLAIVAEDKADYLHVHPVGNPPAGMPLAFEALFPKAGRYQMYLEFKRDGYVRLAKFGVEVR